VRERIGDDEELTRCVILLHKKEGFMNIAVCSA